MHYINLPLVAKPKAPPAILYCKNHGQHHHVTITVSLLCCCFFIIIIIIAITSLHVMMSLRSVSFKTHDTKAVPKLRRPRKPSRTHQTSGLPQSLVSREEKAGLCLFHAPKV